MKKVILKQISLANFKGIKHLEVEFDEKETKIHANNGSGKSSIKNAWEWLLCQNVDDFLPSINNQEIPNLITSVEAIILVDDMQFILKRENKPEYNKDGEKVGNEGKFYIDGINISQSNYKSQIASIFTGIDNFDTLTILTDKDYFNTDTTKWKWDNRRKVLLNMCDIYTQTSHIINQDKYIPIKDYILKGFSTNDIKKNITTEKKTLKKNQEANLVLISSKEKEINEYLGIDFEKVSQELSVAKQKYTKLINSKGENTELDKLNEQLLEYNQELKAFKVRDVLKLKDLEDFKLKIYQEALQTKSEYDKQCSEISQLKKQMEKPNICPVCHQKLPEGEDIKLEENLTNSNKKAKELYLKYNNLQAQYSEYEDKIKNFEPNENINELENKIRDLNRVIQDKNQSELHKLSQQTLKDLEDTISRLEKDMFKKEYLEKGYSQIKAWKSENTTIAEKIIETENKEILLQEFIKEQTNIINNLVNSKFSNGVSWSLYNNNYNGSTDETCICLYNHKRYSSLSNGEKNIVNLEVVKALQNYYDVNIPIFADNEESVTIKYDIDRQIIKFYATIPNYEDESKFININAELFN